MKRARLLLSLANAAFSRTPAFFQALRHLSSHQLPLEARRLEGKVAIITGGASGIGEATAKLFVSHGAHVIIADIQKDLGSGVASSLAPHAHFFHCNVTDEGHVGALVDFALSLHGHVDIMYNNAGIGRAEQGVAELDMEGFRAVMDVNITGAVLGVKHASRAMISKNRGGSILCTASLLGTLPVSFGVPSYIISKHAVVGLVKSSAAELGQYGIRVNCVSPTVVCTPLTTDVFQRLSPGIDVDVIAEKFVELKLGGVDGGGVRAADVANAALFLSSDEARYVSGHNLLIDGAFSACKNLALPAGGG